MKLTNAIRAAFVRAAMNDVPKIDYSEMIRSDAVKAAVEALPADVRKAWGDPKQKMYIETTTRHFGHVGVTIPGYSGGWRDPKELPVFAAKDSKHLEELVGKMNAQEKTRKELDEKLRGAAAACNTRKGLVELLPEFEKYLPADEAASIRTLPAVANIVADFTKAGWPKDKKSTAKTSK